MYSAPRAKYGFTLIEALVAIVVVSIAIVGTMGGFRNLSHIESKSETSEYLQKLAYEKYDELIATAPTTLAATSGDFTDRNITGYSWALAVDTTSVTDLMAVTVTVTQDSLGNSASSPKGLARGLYYQTQTTSTGATP
jgi:prepilin-type N-terminal cleavage/methylation domain-containing protein